MFNSIYGKNIVEPTNSDKAIMAYLSNMGGLSKEHGFNPELLLRNQENGHFGLKLVRGNDSFKISVKKQLCVDVNVENVDVFTNNLNLVEEILDLNESTYQSFGEISMMDLYGRLNYAFGQLSNGAEIRKKVAFIKERFLLPDDEGESSQRVLPPGLLRQTTKINPITLEGMIIN